ncbi:MAG TPA: ATP-binding protein [Candidatus Paceibacterota bacterium]|nr:ATP-binding protein [Candidatus Paceibacterota bacterium]
MDIFSNSQLLLIDASYAFFFLITTIFGILVYLKSSRKTSHVTFLLLSLSVGIYQISHVIGASAVDAESSRIVFQFSLSLIFMVAFMVHWISAVVEREKEYFRGVVAMYAAGVVLLATYLLYPNTYLLPSVPKLYFPNYFQAGSLYWLLVVYFVIGFVILMRMLVKAYRMADATHKNRLAYFMAAVVIGFPLGAGGFLLAYNIPFDPIYSMPFNLFIVPLAYGTLRYDIMNIRLAARKALAYLVFVLGTALFILAANAGQSILEAAYPWLPDWIAPLASSLVIVLFAGYIWERMVDLETLKYEFITVVTHKFRTPLTRIKWASEIIRHEVEKTKSPDQELAVGEIENANEHLVVLTDMLVNLKNTSQSSYSYEFEVTDPCELVSSVVENIQKRVADKKIKLTVDCAAKSASASVDRRRMLFALQIVAENAITYTPEGGTVSISVTHDPSDIYIKITDSGIGIAKEDLSRVFSKFWRSKAAKAVDTEGMGIGLFMAKEIAERHDGDIYASSEGLGKGATFSVRLPLVKE